MYDSKILSYISKINRTAERVSEYTHLIWNRLFHEYLSKTNRCQTSIPYLIRHIEQSPLYSIGESLNKIVNGKKILEN